MAFDSYHTKNDSENPVYEGDGITIDHIMASGTIPIFYKFRDIGRRKFYDGGFLNNTPFRELPIVGGCPLVIGLNIQN